MLTKDQDAHRVRRTPPVNTRKVTCVGNISSIHWVATDESDDTDSEDFAKERDVIAQERSRIMEDVSLNEKVQKAERIAVTQNSGERNETPRI